MTLIVCPGCQKEIRSEAKACPYCGHPIKLYRGFSWRTQAEFNGWPLVHVAFGRDSKTGRLLVAKGIIAVGQFAIGLITVAQFGIGVLFGFGQFLVGITAVAQFAFGLYFGMGQIATGLTAIGQFAWGKYVLAQFGIGSFVWRPGYEDPQASAYFRELWMVFKNFFKDLSG